MTKHTVPSIKPSISNANDAYLRNDEVLDLARHYSPYLTTLLDKHPDCIDRMRKGFGSAIDHELNNLRSAAPFAEETAIKRTLRVAKQRIHLVVAIADLSCGWDCTAVTEALSNFADKAVSLTAQYLLAQLQGQGRLLAGSDEADCGFTVLAMGKHGASELNYSSDIDLIVLTDPSAARLPDRDEAVPRFIRLTQRLVHILQDRTADGYVFRVDLRLRPDPGSMPIVVPVLTALTYYEARGQNWERAAMIKARPVAGDLKLGAWFLEQLQPFMWRRYLDYAAIADIHSIKRQLQAHRDLLDLQVAGHNVKLGRGGIREIEFFVQTQQLIAGGRDTTLRKMQTLDALSALRDAGWIEPDVCKELNVAYKTLRDVEHRLQMIDDQQTHTIPTLEEGRLGVSALSGCEELNQFDELVLANLQTVSRRYAELFEPETSLSSLEGNLSFTDVDPDENTITSLQALGFSDPRTLVTTIRNWHFGRYPAVQSADARQRLTELTPRLLECLAASGNGDAAFLAFDAFLKRLPAGYQLFHLLHANPRLLDLLARILSCAPRLATIIAKRPHVFDGLLEPDYFIGSTDVSSLMSALNDTLDLSRDYEDLLDRARVFADEHRFGIGARVLAGSIDPAFAGDHYSVLAEAVCRVMLARVQAEFALRHGVISGGVCAVVAMGNLGTRELTASSDLDLILLYEAHNDDTVSDGPRPLPASQYYARLTQRFIAAMSAPTAEGVLYELDFRLRPSGNAGPIAVSLSSFLKYQRTEAWTWEHMALTRARPVAGENAFCAKIDNGIADLLGEPRNIVKVGADMLQMRETMVEAKTAKNVWDVKLAKGGLIDLEFLAQFEALVRGERFESTRDSASVTAESLHIDNVTLCDAHSTFRAVLQLDRLCLNEPLDVKSAPAGLIELLLAQLQLPDVKSAEAQLKHLQMWVRQVFLDRLQTVA